MVEMPIACIDGTCRTDCGGLGQPCCALMACATGYTCDSRTCVPE
jgi:hypothetical protein